MNAQNTKKNYKFAFSGIVAILAGLIIAILTFLEFLQSMIDIIADLSFDFSFFIFLIETALHHVPYVFFTLSLFALGVLLILKQRKALLLIAPILNIFGILFYLSATSILVFLLCVFFQKLNYTYAIFDFIGWFVVLFASVLFFIFINSTYYREKRSFGVLAWIAGVIVAWGYGILTIGNIVSKFDWWRAIGFPLSELLDVTIFINALSMVIFPVVFILAGLWIANPYKKNAVVAEDTQAEV